MSELMQRLAAPFDATEIRFKPQVFSQDKTRALAVPYVDARVIEDRLDAIFGIDGWSDDYQELPNGSVVCRLSIRIGDNWVLKTDVGSPSEQPDEHDQKKAAFSDALKRAAVKLGIGRYLYRCPQQWCGWDQKKRCWSEQPRLPAPGKAPASKPAAANGQASNGHAQSGVRPSANGPATIGADSVAKLESLLRAKGKTPASVPKFLRLADPNTPLTALTVDQCIQVVTALKALPDVAGGPA